MFAKLSFFGGAREVTGVNYLLEIGRTKLLIDCGLFQGSRVCEEKNHEPFPYDVSEIDALFVTHAHLDHIGRIPKLVKDGFRGRIFSTPPTRDLAELSLADSLGILTKEAARENQQPIYSDEDVVKAMSLWETVGYDEPFEFGGAKITFRDAGHILGSAMIEMNEIGFHSSNKKLLFTGDLGNPPVPLLKKPYQSTDLDYLIIESAYGDREHEATEDRKLKIERAVESAALNRGVLMVPAFSIERTQQLLYELNDLIENGRIPRMPIFLDSPLAIRATEIYKRYQDYFNKETKFVISSGDDIFKFPGLRLALTTAESKAINEAPPPKIVIAGSGMSIGGRIIHHEKRYLPDPRSILLIVGYQSAGSPGRQLVDGIKNINILGDRIAVRAQVISVRGYSAHADSSALYDFVSRAGDKLKKVFVVQGEPHAALFLTQKIRDGLGIEAEAPEFGDSRDLM